MLLAQYGIDYVSTDVSAPFFEHMGYIWLLTTQLALLGRLLQDHSMIRRPLLEPNLSRGGLIFLLISLFLFLMSNVLTGTPLKEDISAASDAEQLESRAAEDEPQDAFADYAPASSSSIWCHTIVTKRTIVDESPQVPQSETPDEARKRIVYQATARTMAILSQLMVVIGMISIARRHFDNIGAGIAAATLYLMLPYTAIRTGAVIDALPVALILWAVVAYRRPWISGGLIGLATGATYFPIFLLPLWCSFYWQRGVWRFLGGLLIALTIVVISLAFTSADWNGLCCPVAGRLRRETPLHRGNVTRWSVAVLGPRLATADPGGVRRHVLQHGDLAGPEKRRDATEPVGRRDGRHAILAPHDHRPRDGLVSAAGATHGLSPQSRRPLRPGDGPDQSLRPWKYIISARPPGSLVHAPR